MRVLVSPAIAILWVALVATAAALYLAFNLGPHWLRELRDSFSREPMSKRWRVPRWSDRFWLVAFILLVSVVLPGLTCLLTAWIATVLF